MILINSQDLKSVPESRWSENIPGAQASPPESPGVTPDAQILEEVKRLWERANYCWVGKNLQGAAMLFRLPGAR